MMFPSLASGDSRESAQRKPSPALLVVNVINLVILTGFSACQTSLRLPSLLGIEIMLIRLKSES
jgi:hypothetical protein